MRFAVIVFSLILVFAPIHAYALLFIPAVKGAIVRTAGGQFVKTHSKKALVSFGLLGAGKALEDYCKRSKKCDDILEGVTDLFDDTSSSSCHAEKYYLGMSSANKYTSIDDVIDAELKYLKDNHNRIYGFKMVGQDDVDFNLRGFDEIVDRFLKAEKTTSYNQYINGTFTAKFKYNLRDDLVLEKRSFTINAIAKINCDDTIKKDDTKKEITKEQIQKIVNNMSDDDVNYIINNYGDEINIDKYCATAGACDELSNEFGNEVNNKKNEYDIDKINKSNCEVENGKIISCENAKKEKDKDDEQSSSQDDTDDKSQDDAKLPSLIDLPVKDLSLKTPAEFDKDYIDFNGQCPADVSVNIDLAFAKHTVSFGFAPICDFVQNYLSIVVLFGAYLFATLHISSAFKL